MKIYLLIVGFILFFSGLYGFVLPYLVSLAVDSAVFLAIAFIVISIPIGWLWVKNIVKGVIEVVEKGNTKEG